MIVVVALAHGADWIERAPLPVGAPRAAVVVHDVVFVATHEWRPEDGGDSRVYRSRNCGDSWEQVAFVDGAAREFAVHSGRVWLAAMGHLLVSSDGGANWTSAAVPSPGVKVLDLVVHEDKLIAASQRAVFASTDGRTWSELGPLPPDREVDSLSVARGQLSINTQTLSFSDPGIYRWSGAAWVYASAGHSLGSTGEREHIVDPTYGGADRIRCFDDRCYGPDAVGIGLYRFASEATDWSAPPNGVDVVECRQSALLIVSEGDGLFDGRGRVHARPIEDLPFPVDESPASICAGTDPMPCRQRGFAERVVGGSIAAEPYFQRACELGDGAACVEWARPYSEGPTKDLARARDILARSCSARDAEGCWFLGLAEGEISGRWGTRAMIGAWREALRLHRLIPEDRRGCVAAFGTLYEGASVFPADPAMARWCYTRACDLGETEGCAARDRMSAEASAPSSPADACQRGDGLACATLGDQRLASGATMPAYEAYKMGCGFGDGTSCSLLGLMHFRGDLGERDYESAGIAFGWACDGNDPGGCVKLGQMYENGYGVEPDPVQAEEQYRLARERLREEISAGFPMMSALLGWLHENGKGGAADPAAALDAYRVACTAGDADACQNAERLRPSRP
jgi:TPR repeat protein